jgi:hypothetical protein
MRHRFLQMMAREDLHHLALMMSLDACGLPKTTTPLHHLKEERLIISIIIYAD